MKISVIIPVYNRLEHLRAGFLCLLRQERQPDELIITDDGSSQKVLDFIGDLIPKAKFKIKHIYQEDKGFRKTRALNNAVRNCEGELLVFCDQDLIFGEDYLKTIERELKEGYFIMGRPENTTEIEKKKIISEINEDLNYSKIAKLVNSEYEKVVNKLLREDVLRNLLFKFKLKKRGIKLVGMSYALFKKDYIKVNGYDEKYKGWGEEDDDFGNRLSVAKVKGKTFKTKELMLHLWHPFDPTKKKSANEEYYYVRKKEIFSKNNFFCEYGYNNPLDKDEVKVLKLK